MWLDFVASFSIQTVEGSGYYVIESPLPYIMRNLTTQHYFSSLNNNSVV